MKISNAVKMKLFEAMIDHQIATEWLEKSGDKSLSNEDRDIAWKRYGYWIESRDHVLLDTFGTTMNEMREIVRADTEKRKTANARNAKRIDARRMAKLMETI